MAKSVVFEIDVVEREVTLHSKSSDKATHYLLREMSGAKKELYLNAIRQNSRIAENGDIIVKDYQGMFAQLLSYCMVTKDGAAVDCDEIEKLPARVLTDLSKIAKEINALTVADANRMVEEAKNA